MGHRKGVLAESIKTLAAILRSKFSSGQIDLDSLEAKSSDNAENDGHINLLDDILSQKVLIDYHARDPQVNYELRRNELRTLMDNIHA